MMEAKLKKVSFVGRRRAQSKSLVIVADEREEEGIYGSETRLCADEGGKEEDI